MKKGLKIALITLVGLVGLMVAVFVGLQLALNSKLATDAVDNLAKEYVDGTLGYSRLRVRLLRRFPRVSISIEGVSLTYPHTRFTSFEGGAFPGEEFSLPGRGESADTLLRLDRLCISASPLKFLRGEIVVQELSLKGLSAYVHNYDSLASNLSLIRVPETPDSLKTEGGPLNTPYIDIGRISIEDVALVYTDAPSALRARLALDALSLNARLKFTGDSLSLKDAGIGMDSLRLYALGAADTLDLKLGRLGVRESGAARYELELQALAKLASASLGRLSLPLDIGGGVRFEKNTDNIQLGASSLTATLADIPLGVDGDATIYPDSLIIKTSVSLGECSLQTLLREYVDAFVPLAKSLDTDARLTADFTAEGVYSRSSIPSVSACIRIPASTSRYIPEALDIRHTIDIDAELSPDRTLVADIHEFKLSVPGLDIDFDGRGDDLLGRDPIFTLSADARANVEKLLAILPVDSLGIEHAEGDFRLVLDGHARRSELQDFRFQEAKIRGALTSSHLHLKMPADTLEACLYNTALDLHSGPLGLAVSVGFDSVYFYKGADLTARVRNIRNEASITKVAEAGEMLPRMEVSTDSERAFLRLGTSRLASSGMNIRAAVQKKTSGAEHRSRYVSRIKDKAFEDADLDFSLDSSFVRYLREWSASGHIKADSGFFASPSLPLRTRLTALHADFDDDKIQIDTIGISCGTSDVSLAGTVSGVKNALIAKDLISANLDLRSRRINANEILAAFLVGREKSSDSAADIAPQDEIDESFVTDTLTDARVDIHELPIFVLPANIDATIKLEAERVDYSDPKIGPFYSGIRVKDRTAQLTGTYITTELGRIYMDAFYSTKSRNDISAGANLNLTQMAAKEIIQLFPAVDSLMPVLKAFEGKLSCEVSATTKIDTTRRVILPTFDGLVRVTGKGLKVLNDGQFGKVANLLLFKKKEVLEVDNLHIDALVHDSRIEVFPFVLGAGKYRLALRGTQGFDNSMFYHLSVLKAPFPVLFGINVYGTEGVRHVQVGKVRYREGSVPSYTAQLDTVQYNLAYGIQNIFNRGVDEVIRRNESAVGALESGSGALAAAPDSREDLEESAYGQYAEMADNYIVEQEMRDQDEALEKEVNSALESSSLDAARMMKEYESSIGDSRFERWLSKVLGRRNNK